MNKVILLGRLGRDPELKYTNSGQAVVNFSVATDESYTNKDSGEKVKKTEWHKCTAWGRTGENIAKFFKGGGLILVEGKLETREWTDKEGGKRKSTEIRVFTFGFAGDNGKGGGGDQAPAESTAPAGGEISDEDIPF